MKLVRFCWFKGLVVVLLHLCAFSAVSQTGTTEGKEFFFGFLINGSSDNLYNLSVHISTKKATSGTLAIPGVGYEFPFTLQANSSRDIFIPANFRPNEVGEKERLAVTVSTSEDVSVYAYNELSDSGDASMVLPLQSLSDEYLIHTYNNDFFQQSLTQNQVLLVGTQDTTIYEFVPTADIMLLDETVLFQSGEAIRDTLLYGEQIAYHAVDNLSGSIVRTINIDSSGDCEPLAVFVGHVATQVDVCLSSDHLFNQLYAPADWGDDYLVIPFETRFGGDVVQLMAGEDNTVVTINTNTQVRLNKGERHTFLAPVVTSIKSSKPISVMQLSRGKSCDEAERGDNLADPFMILLSPANQIIKEITFPVFKNVTVEKFFLNMVVPATDIEVRLDGQDISGLFQVSAQNPDYAFATVPIGTGTRILTSKNGVVAHLYAFGDSESYGVAIGGNLGEFDVEILDEQRGVLVGENISVCEDSDLTFNVTSDIKILKESYQNFKWILGNGVILDGDQVNFEFDSAGVYTLDMIASKGESKCSQLIVSRVIEVVENALDDIEGPASVCPNAQDIVYNVLGAQAGYTYEWQVSGGRFDGTNIGQSVTIDWSIADPGAKVSVYSISPQGCISDTIDFDIVLNEVLAPSAPQGPAQLCATDIKAIVYSTPKATGSTYTWEAIGGKIVSGQGTEKVAVNWSGTGQHVLRFYESTTVNNLCAGVSEDLQVTVYEPITYDFTTRKTTCFGEPDGSAILEINGGLAPYQILWDDGTRGLENNELSGGSYRATITDALGCILKATVRIEEPEQLSVAAIVQDAICNGERGFADIRVQGGTAPFQFNWADGPSLNSAVRNGLGEGSYALEVVDANGCAVSVNLSIQEPAALEATYEVRPACPEAADGRIALQVDGGVAPYTYIWEVNPQVNNATISDLEEGFYSVTVIDAAGCELSLEAWIENLDPVITLPTAFTPNNDGVNDTFGAVFNCKLETELVIYNKWGQLMFRSLDIDEQWNGSYQGNKAPSGSYTYQLKYYTTFNGSPLTEIVSGRVQLIR